MTATRQPPFFKFSRETNSVRVENVSQHFNRREVIALFNTLVGEVRSSQESKDASGNHLDITFSSRDAAKKALCMSGYTVSGIALLVTPITLDTDNGPAQVKRSDGRRNLYVLGLPFALTKTEFIAIFSRYGTVCHCVILATADNASRRRGFIVMSTHEEAKKAMSALTRTQQKGHVLDISWAVVQRSEGFLDGGDRTTMLLSARPVRAASPEPSQLSGPAFRSMSSSDSSISESDSIPSLTVSAFPTSTIVVTNLPSLLFSDLADLHPLFYPFGQIKKLEVLADSAEGATSVLVEYTSAVGAQEAKETIQGQSYAGFKVNVLFVRSVAQVLDDKNTKTNHMDDFQPLDSVLAASSNAFLLGSGRTNFYYDAQRNCYNNHNDAPRNLLQPQQHPYLYASPPSIYPFYGPSGSRWIRDSASTYLPHYATARPSYQNFYA